MSADFLSRTRAFAAALALGAGGPAAAQDGCPALGFESPYLEGLYCQRLKEIAADAPDAPTRGVDLPDDDFRRVVEGNPLIRDAYHADPKKTLDLIKRIRDAGGLTTQ